MDNKFHPENNEPDKQDTSHSKKEASDKQDFFETLQAKEAQEGQAVRGKGHGWATFIETLLCDW